VVPKPFELDDLLHAVVLHYPASHNQ
jgi:hypothetical protein